MIEPTPDAYLAAWARSERAGRDALAQLRASAGDAKPRRVKVESADYYARLVVENTYGFEICREALVWVLIEGRNARDFPLAGPGETAESALRRRHWLKGLSFVLDWGIPSTEIVWPGVPGIQAASPEKSCGIVISWFRRNLVDPVPLIPVIDVGGDKVDFGRENEQEFKLYETADIDQHELLVDIRNSLGRGRIQKAQHRYAKLLEIRERILERNAAIERTRRILEVQQKLYAARGRIPVNRREIQRLEKRLKELRGGSTSTPPDRGTDWARALRGSRPPTSSNGSSA